MPPGNPQGYVTQSQVQPSMGAIGSELPAMTVVPGNTTGNIEPEVLEIMNKFQVPEHVARAYLAAKSGVQNRAFAPSSNAQPTPQIRQQPNSSVLAPTNLFDLIANSPQELQKKITGTDEKTASKPLKEPGNTRTGYKQ